MSTFQVGDKVIYKKGQALPAKAVIKSFEGCPLDQVLIEITEGEALDAVGMVPISTLTPDSGS